MVIVERSRSPLRSSPTLDGTRPLVNFPVWTRPMGYGATPQGKGQQVVHPMPSQWNQGNPGVQATQEIPLSQGSMQIPPGQVGASQHSFGMSQPNSGNYALLVISSPWTTSCFSSSSSSRHGFGWHDANLPTSPSILGSPSGPRTSPSSR